MDETEPITDRTERRRQAHSRSARNRGLGSLLALGAILVLVGIGTWLLFRDDGSDDTSAEQATPVAATTAALSALAADVKHPVYWAGTRAGNTYELTRTRDGRIYIRYLPHGVDVGDPSPKYTTVGTYPEADAYAATVQASKREGAQAYNTKSGALVVTNAATPTSVYFAFKGVPYLVEVFDPSATRALDLALSGKIRLVR
jgi:hypothetical protein